MTKKSVTVSVPGKIHLMGEHAVVYGKPALLSAINLRLNLTIETGSSGKLKIITSETTEFVKYAIDFLLAKFEIKNPPPLTVTIRSQIPPGYHLGSSASVAVATSAAFLYFFKKIWNPMRANELAYEIEKKQHINPSGGDNSVVTFGGLIWFRKEFEFLKNIWQLPFKPADELDHFYLIDTGRPLESTGEMVQMVRAAVNNNPVLMQDVFSRNETEVKKITLAIKETNEKLLIESMRNGQRTLEAMGVTSPKVLPVIREIEKVGGAAKILGGGGKKSGVGFILVYNTKAVELKYISELYKYPMQKISLGGEGVKLEKK